MMLIGSERLVLQSVQNLPKDQYGNVQDDEIAGRTELTIQDVRRALEVLAGKGLVGLVRLTDRYSACPAPEGDLWLSQQRSFPDDARVIQEALKTATIAPKGSSHALLLAFTALVLTSVVLLSRDASPLRLRPLKRWGELSAVSTTFLPALGGTVVGLLLPLRGKGNGTMALAVLIPLAVACISPVAYNSLTDTPPTPGNDWYYGRIGFALLVLSNVSLGVFISMCLSVLALWGEGDDGASLERPGEGGGDEDGQSG